ncbi:hypothetical protein ACFL3E_02290 [Patescibacteria group bacterium]
MRRSTRTGGRISLGIGLLIILITILGDKFCGWGFDGGITSGLCELYLVTLPFKALAFIPIMLFDTILRPIVGSGFHIIILGYLIATVIFLPILFYLGRLIGWMTGVILEALFYITGRNRT